MQNKQRSVISNQIVEQPITKTMLKNGGLNVEIACWTADADFVQTFKQVYQLHVV